MSVLDRSYFELLSSQRESDGQVIQSYRVVHPNSTAILFSAEGVPLAGLTFLPVSYGKGNAKAVLTRRQASPEMIERNLGLLQGLMNVDNEEFTLTIHNLTHRVVNPSESGHSNSIPLSRVGMVKVDILQSDVPVNSTDPPENVNRVNELRPSQSFTVVSNQQTGYKTMILRGVETSQGTKVTVSADDQAVAEDRKGTYFWINVTASTNIPDLCAQFVGSRWASADVLTRTIHEPVVERPVIDRYRSEFPVRAYNDHFQYWAPTWTPQAAAASAPVAKSSVARRGGQTKGVMEGMMNSRMDSQMNSQMNSQMDRRLMDTVAEQFAVAQDGATPTRSEILDSNVGQVVSGSRTIHQDGNQTGVVYDYACHGERVMLGLSVWREMRVYDPLTRQEAVLEAKAQIDDLVNRANVALINSLKTQRVFRAEHCVVCLDHFPETVFYRCGHECVCSECYRKSSPSKCYLCRSRIIASIYSF